MFYVLQNESTAALRRVPILLTDAATGTTAQTGVAISNIYPSVNINGGAFAGGAGTVAEAGYGQYYYEFDAAEVATLGLAGIHVTAVGCRDYDAICQVAAFNVYSASGVGITAGDVWSYDISGVVGAGLAGSQLNVAATGGAGITAGDVWSYVIPGPSDPAETVLANINTNASNASSQTTSSSIRDAVWDTDVSYLYPSGQAGGALYAAAFGATDAGAQVWNYDISAISGAGLAGTQLNIAAGGGAGITAGDVWAFDVIGFGGTSSAAVTLTETLFTTGNIETYVANQTPQDVWTYAGIEGRTITGGIADTVTSVINTVDISTQSITDIWSEDVSGYSTPSAGYDLSNASSGAGITAGDVWNYSGSYAPGTSGDALNIAATDSAIAAAGVTSNAPSEVWSYISRTLTSAAGVTAGDIWNYTLLSSGQSADATLGNADDQATGAKTNTNSPTLEANIWSYATRTTTGGTVTNVTNPVAVSTTSMSGIAGTVWATGTRTITGGTITTNSDKTGYSLSGTQSFNLTGNITGNISGSVASVTNPVSVSTASMSGIAGTTWSYVTRTLTSGAGLSAADVWNYDIDAITASGSAGKQLNDAAVSGSVVTIVNGPYRVTSTAEGTDGIIDILADSIQPITIYCINGFAQPFNITGYTASVDIYDEAGGFVISYTPTIDYALGGILTFNIDADVTGIIGRYTLVVSLTDGDVVQLGPLTILVRPL